MQQFSEIGIGELSRRTGVKVPTIRYYESEGLLPVPDRSEGNQRRYGRSHLERLRFIRHARDLGIPTRAVRELVQLSGQPEQCCDEANRIACQHLADVRDRISRLRSLEKELERIAKSCQGGTIGQCSVIAALSDHAMCGSEHAV
jgi:DNA-binding transcriptional MerR regulator